MTGDRHTGDAPAQLAAHGAAGRSWSRYGDARTAVVRDVLRAVTAAMAAEAGRPQLDIIDAGGGTGGFAVPLAALGHHVTVIDPSPDSLAAAERRAAEMNVRITVMQGDAADLAAVAGAQSADLVLCHSVLAASAVAAVIHRALAGRFDDARRLLAGLSTGSSQPAGIGAGPGVPRARWFTIAGVVSLLEGAGLRAGSALGVRVFADLVPGMFADADPGAADALLALEQAASAHPAFGDIATQFHIVGYR